MPRVPRLRGLSRRESGGTTRVRWRGASYLGPSLCESQEERKGGGKTKREHNAHSLTWTSDPTTASVGTTECGVRCLPHVYTLQPLSTALYVYILTPSLSFVLVPVSGQCAPVAVPCLVRDLRGSLEQFRQPGGTNPAVLTAMSRRSSAAALASLAARSSAAAPSSPVGSRRLAAVDLTGPGSSRRAASAASSPKFSSPCLSTKLPPSSCCSTARRNRPLEAEV